MSEALLWATLTWNKCRSTPLSKHSVGLARAYCSSLTNRPDYDLVIVGGGIVGCATARELSIRHPKLKMAILEKENELAAHQSGHNSGVIHAGIYYKPGTLKAKLCVKGLDLAYKYFDEKSIPYKKCGKLIVATTKEEVERLDGLYERGLVNGVQGLKLISGGEIKIFEPNCVGLKAIWSPNTGIVDWANVTKSYADDFKNNGGTVKLNFKVRKFECADQGLIRITNQNDSTSVSTKYVLTAAGLHADRMAALTGCNREPRIIPFRGEYLLLKKEKCNLINGNIYPVPDPRFPFLGVHFTPRMDGSVWLGPNAVLAYKREGYKFSDFSLRDILETLSFRGFRVLAWKYFSHGTKELYRSFVISEQVKLLQRFVPSLTKDDVEFGPTGVRAQAIDVDGNLVDDFIFDCGQGEMGRRVLHVRNAPSPAATSSLAIAEIIAEKINITFLTNEN